jgi:parvulin-like peptidyl-prolyl isomerase
LGLKEDPMNRLAHAALAALACSLPAVAGCNWLGLNRGPEPLRAKELVRPQVSLTVPVGPGAKPVVGPNDAGTSAAARRVELADNPGLVEPNAQRSVGPDDFGPPARGPDASVGVRDRGPSAAAGQPPAREPGTGDVSPGVAAAIPGPSTQPAARSGRPPTTGPSRGGPSSAGNGTFTTVGGVVATVSGEPIFADKLLRQVEPILRDRARDAAGQRQFGQIAATELRKQLDLLIASELEFAAANQGLDVKDKERANVFTGQQRDKLVTAAGGSLEQAKLRAREDGRDFDELINEIFRTAMVRLYYDRKISPRVQITANDIRRYYERHKDDQFSDRAQARFRLIKVSGKQAGSADEAKKKIEQARQRVTAGGEEFAKVAAELNRDPMLTRNQGDVGMIDKGAFVVEPVENAVWQLDVGQVTPVVRVGDDFFIARLEEKKAGNTRSFSDPAVQKQIRDALEAEQIAQLRQRAREDLMKQYQGAVIYNNAVLQTTMETVMAAYPKWSGREAR